MNLKSAWPWLLSGLLVSSLVAGSPASPKEPAAPEEEGRTSLPSESAPIEGWPVSLQQFGSQDQTYTPTLVDVDGDGVDEIYLYGAEAFGLAGDGTFLPGWPEQEKRSVGYISFEAIVPGPSVGDFEGDGDLEVVWSQVDTLSPPNKVYSFNARYFDGSNLPGFPFGPVGKQYVAMESPLVLADTDGNGELEGWTAHRTTLCCHGYDAISAVDHTGTILFTNDLRFDLDDFMGIFHGDVDGSGEEEIFAVSHHNAGPLVNELYAFESNGSVRTGYPLHLSSSADRVPIDGPPIPVDLDDDGDLEILFGETTEAGSWVRCFHHEAVECSGFPLAIAGSAKLDYMSLGDVTGDTEPELILIDEPLSGPVSRLLVYDLSTGALLPGWPFAIEDWLQSVPSVVDIDGNGLQDILATAWDGRLYALDGTGSQIAGYPKVMRDGSGSGATAGDIDGDGLYELVSATTTGWVYAWDTTGSVSAGADWPMRGVDVRNTGVFTGRPEDHPRLVVSGTCPGEVSVSLFNAPPASEVAIVAAANLNGWTKGGLLCNGTRFEIGEPFQLPPHWIRTDQNGEGQGAFSLGPDRCWVEALALQSCTTSPAYRVP